jgi:hypothetical protein
MKIILIIFLIFGFINSSFAAWEQEGIKFYLFDTEGKVISCKYRMTGDKVLRTVSVWFELTDLNKKSSENIGLFNWNLKEDSIHQKSEDDIPVGGCLINGILTVYDSRDSIFTIDLKKNEIIWTGYSKVPIAAMQQTESMIYILKKNGDLDISNNLTGENLKRINSFCYADALNKLVLHENLFSVLNQKGKAFIYDRSALKLLDSISNIKIISHLNQNEIIYSTFEDSLFFYDLKTKKTVKYIFEKPESTNLSAIIACGKNHFAIELSGKANSILLINKSSSENLKTLLLSKSKQQNYEGPGLLGFFNGNIVTYNGCNITKGEYMKEIPCTVDVKNITNQAVDQANPVILVDFPAGSDKLETSDEFVFVKGKITDDSELKFVKINDKDIPFLKNSGEFNGYIKLDSGLNIMEINCSDFYGNVAQKVLKINKTAGTRSVNVSKAKQEFEQLVRYNYHALIIAEQDYEDERIKDLVFPKLDAENVSEILCKYYTFEDKNVKIKINPSRNEVLKTLDTLLYSLTPNDHLLIFYAGHGIFDEKLKRGYWLPSDANMDNRGSWISNSEIRDYIAGFDSKHTLLITDACFSGSIFEYGRDVVIEQDKVVSTLLKKKSRTAMTSGLDNVVPDKSIFLQYFLKNLVENPNKYISAGNLYNELKEAVISNTNNQPQYGVIQNANHEGGEFIFLKKE